MKTRFVLLFGYLLAGLAFANVAPALADSPTWHLTGDLSEACSCSVPCACNFAQSPSPHPFCWAIFSLDIQKGNFGDTNLDGLRMAGANGAKGGVWYIDDRATKEQEAALRKIGDTVWWSAAKANGVTDPKKAPPEYKLLGYKRAKIEQIVTDKRNYLKIVGVGGFDSDYLLGIDGKTPVIVENNASWNIQHGIKAKTKQMTYKDSFGNSYAFKATNSNQGKFDWSDTTPIYFR